ncbi:hypothetical protein FLAG1_07921 [Fusarium langsethiae]|uniref:Uncharacterized protein n=1 Tax=Fusarium langsethiae TaxID=179993 RepID=A0A0N0V5Y8_FUSLA|nr:hypothetical protein FLAG1_07921 [Fusarium langsethiae]GKU05629.1 unnamed protein product [Fusarium langsethiae]
MRSYTLISGLSLIIPSFALVAYQPCLTTTALPLVTVIGGPDGYYSEDTRTYREFCPQGLTTKVYTITQICSNIDCQTPPIETAPPPGFTAAVVKCSACGGQGTQVATLTFPTESLEAYSSSGYLVQPLDSAQATKAWADHVNSPPAVETTIVNNGDTGMNAENISPTPGSSDHTGVEPKVSNNGGGSQDQNGNEGLGDTSSHHAATENTGSTGADDSANSQNGGNLDGTSSAKEWQPGTTGEDSLSGDTPAGSIPQHGSSSGSSSSSSSQDATESQEHALNVPGHSNDATGDNPAASPTSGVASVDGEPINNNNTPDETANTASPSSINGAPGSTSVSPDNNSGPPPVIDSDSKYTGNDDDSQGPDAPLIVSSAGSSKTSIPACVIANVACIFVVWLL